MKDMETFWRECELKHPGNFALVKKLNLVAHKFRTWNHDVFGNQDNRLQELQDKIRKLEEEMEVRDARDFLGLVVFMIIAYWKLSTLTKNI
jgi:hypothetical protein